MNAKSGSGRSGAFVWGIVAGILAVIGAGGLYLSGVLGPDSQTGQSQEDKPAAVASDDPATEPAQSQAELSVPAGQGDGTEKATEGSQETATSEATTTANESAPAAQGDDGTEPPAEAATDTTDESGSTDAAEDSAQELARPVLDQIFVEADGNAVLSGNGVPGSRIRVLLDGEPVHSFTVDDSGQFAEFINIPFSESARGLVLETSDGAKTMQSDDYLIASLPKPAESPETAGERVASADIAPAAEAESEPVNDTQGDAAEQTQDSGATADVLEDPKADAAENAGKDQQIAVLRSGEAGVEVVQSPSTETSTPDQVALDTIGYSDAGDVQLAGRVAEGSAVRLYLNNKLVADIAPEQDGGWRGEIGDVDPGVYTLRVDEVDTDGTVLSRLETPFKREPVEVLQAAEAQDATPGADQSTPIRSVTVQKGDTLWAISRDRFGDGVLYVRLFDANRDLIRDPDLIYPGQVFTIPE